MTKLLPAAIMVFCSASTFLCVIGYGDRIDLICYVLLSAVVTFLCYKHYAAHIQLFIFFSIVFMVNYLDSLNKVIGFPDGDDKEDILYFAFFILHVVLPFIIVKNKKKLLEIIIIFSILFYTPIVGAPASFIRQIVGAYLIKDNENEIYCVTKITPAFICVFGEIDNSESNCLFRLGYVYEYSYDHRKYEYKDFILLSLAGFDYGVYRGSMDEQLANMKNYYINFNHCIFKIFKEFF